jgi:poly(3-hydroxybutyrate) depolymerase
MNRLTSTAAMLAILGTLILPASAEPIKSGLHSQTVIVRDTPIEVQAYRPSNCRIQGLLLAFHGSERNPRAARQAARPLADRSCLILLAPYFDNARFPLARYNWGGVVVDHKLQPPEGRTGHLAIDLVAWARREVGEPLPYMMIGHSAGAQFLARLAAFVHNEAKRIVIANAGAHVFPSVEVNAPYGFGKLYAADEADKAMLHFLAQPLTFLQGEEDTDENDPAAGRAAKSQGKSRLERGLSTFEAGRKLAESRRCPFGWRLIKVPGVGHSSLRMYGTPQAAEALAP